MISFLQVGPLTSPKKIHCMTNHLTSFGSGMFVAPNPIDFSKALAGFKDAFETGNVAVLFTIVFLLLLYALLAVWAWRADRKDAMQASNFRALSATSKIQGYRSVFLILRVF